MDQLVQLLNGKVRERAELIFQQAFLASDLNATGDTAQSFEARVLPSIDGAHLEVYAREQINFVLYGRGPGKPPPVDVIERYLDAVGSNADPYAVAINIGKFGTLRGDEPAEEYFGSVEADLFPFIETALTTTSAEDLLFPTLDASFTESVRI